jgi:hypothetical protein
MFGISIVKKLSELAERVYHLRPSPEGIEMVDSFYKFIEDYDVDKRNT